MASTLVDLVKINIASTGTGALTLGSAVEGYRGAEALTNGRSYSYSIQQGGNFEFGKGTYLSSTSQLTRSVLGSSIGGTPINLVPNGEVSFTALAEDMSSLTATADAQAAAIQTAADAANAQAAAAQAQAAAANAQAAVLGLPYFPILNASTAAGGSNIIPQGITSGTVGGTAVTGATPGTYALTSTGGDFTGVQANLVVADATHASVVIVTPGRTTSASPTAPTWANPVGATLPGGTTLTANIDTQIGAGTGQYYLTSDSTGNNLLYWQNTGSGAPVAVNDAAGSQVSYALAKQVATLRSQNFIFDPWMRELGKNHHQANGTSTAFLGTLTVPDTASPVNDGGSLSATGTSQARRIVPLPDNVAIGDVITAMGVCSATGATQFTLTFLDSALATISSVNASGTFTGTAVSQSVTTTVPATTAYLQYGLSSSGSSTKTLYGTFLGKGGVTPGRTEADSYIYPIAPLNKYPDHLCGLSGLGVVQVDTYPLLGANVAGAAIETAPAESPFGGKAILLPSGAAAHDLKCAASRLGLEPGKPIFVNVGYVYASQVTTTIGFYDNTDTLIGSAKTVFIDCRNPVTLVKEYGELRTEMPVDATTATTAAYLKIRSFTGGAATSDCHLIGVSIASRPHYISAAQPVLAAGSPTTRSAIPARVLGKKIVIFGDSVLGNSINVDTGPNHNWRADNYIAEEIGANVFNFAIGGTTYAGRVSTDYDPFSMSALADAMVSGDWSAQSAVVSHLEAIDTTRLAGMMAMDWTTVDAILCQHGTNDYGAEQKAIGSNSDTTRATFKGGINNTIKQVLLAAPQTRLILFTPLWREEFLDSFAGNVSITGTTLTVNSVATTGLTAGNSILARGITRRTTILSQTSGTAGGVGTYTIDQPWTVTAVSGFGYDPTTNGRDHANSQGNYLPDYVQAIKDIAALHNIPVVDLYQGLGFGPDNSAWWCNDGLHPNGWNALPVLSRFIARVLANYV